MDCDCTGSPRLSDHTVFPSWDISARQSLQEHMPPPPPLCFYRCRNQSPCRNRDLSKVTVTLAGTAWPPWFISFYKSLLDFLTIKQIHPNSSTFRRKACYVPVTQREDDDFSVLSFLHFFFHEYIFGCVSIVNRLHVQCFMLLFSCSFLSIFPCHHNRVINNSCWQHNRLP